MGKAAIIKEGDRVQLLKSIVSYGLSEASRKITGDADNPRVVPKTAPIGSSYWRAGTTEVYFKLDSGSSINWILLDDQVMQYIGAATGEPTGFPTDGQLTDSVVTFDAGTRTLSIAPTGSDFSFWQKGKLYTIDSQQDVVWDNTEGSKFFYFDDGVLTVINTFDPDLILDFVYVHNIYWDATNLVVRAQGEERHGLMPTITHSYLHQFFGTQFLTGAALTNFSTDGSGSADSELQFTIDPSTIQDEDIVLSQNGVDLTLAEVIRIFYKSGANGDWRFEEKTIATINSVGTGRAAYNEFTGAVWQLTEVPNNDFVLAHVFISNEASNSPYKAPIIVLGQDTYTSLGNARDGATVEINNLVTSGLAFQEFCPAYTFIIQTKNSNTNAGKARFRSIDGGSQLFIDWRSSGLSPTATPGSHDLLSNLTNSYSHTQYPRLTNQNGHVYAHDMQNVSASTTITETVREWDLDQGNPRAGEDEPSASTVNCDLSTRYYSLDSGTNAQTVNLPAVSGSEGAEFSFHLTNDTNGATIQPRTGETLNGVTNGTIVLSVSGDGVTVYCDASGWRTKA